MALQSLHSQGILPFRDHLVHLPQYGSLDDFAAMAVLATLTALYLTRGIVWGKPNPYLHKMFESPQEKMGGLADSESTRNIAEKLEQTVRTQKLLIKHHANSRSGRRHDRLLGLSVWDSRAIREPTVQGDQPEIRQESTSCRHLGL